MKLKIFVNLPPPPRIFRILESSMCFACIFIGCQDFLVDFAPPPPFLKRSYVPRIKVWTVVYCLSANRSLTLLQLEETARVSLNYPSDQTWVSCIALWAVNNHLVKVKLKYWKYWKAASEHAWHCMLKF